MHLRQPLTVPHLLLIGCILAGTLLAPAARAAATAEQPAPGRIMAQQAVKSKPPWITTDHSRHEALKQPLSSGPEVTQACLSCHNQAALQFHQTIHWTLRDNSTENSLHGKGGLSINNF